MTAKIRKPLAPPTRPHSERVKPDVVCQACGGAGWVMGMGSGKTGPDLVDCPRCYPDAEENDDE